MTAVMLLVTLGVLFVDGRIPAGVPESAPAYAPTGFAQVLRAVDARGQVDLAQLKAEHAKLTAFLASLAVVSPDTRPEDFPSHEARLAYWLNAYHALVLRELLDVRGARLPWAARFSRGASIGGLWLTRFSLERNELQAAGDARVWLALFDGTRGAGVLDAVPFDGDTLKGQLDDAARRFIRRRGTVRIEGAAVWLHPVFSERREDFLAALPDERKHVLQVVWAFLPEDCSEGVAGCPTRSELDRVCGPRFDRCEVRFAEREAALAVKN